MWLTVFSLLVVPKCLPIKEVLGIMIYPDDYQRLVHEDRGVFQDQEGDFSEFIKRGNKKFSGQRHQFGMKIKQPSGQVLEQKDHQELEGQMTQRQNENNQSYFHPSQNEGDWKGIRHFGIGEYQQVQLVLQPEQRLKEEIEVARARQHFGQINNNKMQQTFRRQHEERRNLESSIQKHNEYRQLENEKDYKTRAEAVKEIENEELEGGDRTNLSLFQNTRGFSDLSHAEKETTDGSKRQQKVEHTVGNLTDNKELSDTFINKFPFQRQLLTSKQHQIDFRKPNFSDKEKKALYAVKEQTPQPFNVYKRLPFRLNTSYMPKPHHFLVENKFPFHFEKQVPFSHPLRVHVDKPTQFHLPVFKPVPYSYAMVTKGPYSFSVPMDNIHAFVPKPNLAHFERPSHTALEQFPVPLYLHQNQQRHHQPPHNFERHPNVGKGNQDFTSNFEQQKNVFSYHLEPRNP